MSGTVGGGPANPDGRGSSGGGDDGGRHPLASGGGVSGGVTNQSILPLDHSIHANLDAQQHRALKKIQLEFARDVSARAADAYDETLRVLGLDDKPRSPG